jgi:UDP-N-acetyl-D-glucosamine/UDP-N-acetyl-D-galactosamine dehydrogenase
MRLSPAGSQVTVIGLGYVGLPLAVALARHFRTTGFDVDAGRIAELLDGHDRTNEISTEVLNASDLAVVDDAGACPPSEFYIVTVPTPIDAARRPDLSIIRSASVTVGRMLRRAGRRDTKPVVVYESTVYPGVTEGICAAILEAESGLVCGADFFLGYSPERINPGDREHTVDKITKVVSGQTDEVLERVARLYGAITSGGVFRARSISVAEAAKVIENAQRDINIAFMNEIAQIFGRMDISVWDVLETARTKWNFLPFSPGLVGGHCIGVDPYYLSHRAEELGLDPQVILSGRSINDSMAHWVADRLHELRGSAAGSVLVLGLTFKEDVPDLRNSKVADLISTLAGHGHRVTVHDPLASPAEALHEFGIALEDGQPTGRYDLVLLAVAHKAYLDLGAEALRDLLHDGGTLADLKGVLGSAADWTL